ncbi:hypothetical protein BDA99DRAFT_559565 [Phascolomyces articulosus]|uniref:Uncharacterized protein n=1 Tax=Phascolomyces articulosus TaxID=60185 RepID=A0AAD5KEU5_9FUNG|nr:hypothetical protein BDA99DRAFT_559565 [Phascolomyces articulosus]
MQITSTYATNEKPFDNGGLTIQIGDFPPSPGDITKGDSQHDYHLCVLVQLTGASKIHRIKLAKNETYYTIFVKEESLDRISKELQRLSRSWRQKRKTYDAKEMDNPFEEQ